MSALEPIINLLVFLTALSVAAERITNVIKLGNRQLRDERDTKLTEKQREQGITNRGVLLGIVLAVVLKADLIAALNHLDAPWETMGWLQMRGSMWVPAPETGSFLTIAYAVIGSAITGAALGFGSKFWHEVLDAVLELRNMAKLRNVQTRTSMSGSGSSATPGGE